MELRNWQSECINLAISKYDEHVKHFLALATPGAGKTYMASVLAKQLFELNKIDLILCFSPSSIVSNDFNYALSKQFNRRFDGSIGALGNSYTYQGLSSLGYEVWGLFERYRIFVIFDEIHHCAGSNIHNANSWGESIITKIKDKAAYTIALTGTPWRSDALPISLAEYSDGLGQVSCNYTYGLKAAIKDKVCRVPSIIVLDNDNITVAQAGDVTYYSSFFELLSQSIISYSEIVRNESVIEQLLAKADSKLNSLRLVNHNAGGLIVASSISHAWKIQTVLKRVLGEVAYVVTSDENSPNKIIEKFRNSTNKWIISVGMISEGTNIPRLQVCCYLSNIKTEMYFRQVLGRILRFTRSKNQEALLFMPAEPKLVEYAHRVSQDIPQGLADVKFFNMDEKFETEVTPDNQLMPFKNDLCLLENKNDELNYDIDLQAGMDAADLNIKEASTYERVMGISGQYKHEMLHIEGFENLVISEKFIEKLNHYR